MRDPSELLSLGAARMPVPPRHGVEGHEEVEAGVLVGVRCEGERYRVARLDTELLAQLPKQRGLRKLALIEERQTKVAL